MEDEDDELKKPEASSSRKELSIKVDGKGSGNDQRPNTPRSKHSATEQRRRSKINDRFQILRGIIPHSDQKRDKASFLLEVIEYIRFLQEKVNKYETQYPEWNQDPSKLTTWHNSQAPANGSAPAAHILSGSGFPVGSSLIPSAHNTDETDASANAHYKTADVATDFPNADYTTSQDQSQWLRPSVPTECAESGEMLNGQEELIIDEGTINVSTAYSQELMMSLGQALQHSGLDLSQASISVQISLGKRAINRGNVATAATSNSVDPGGPESDNQAVGHSKMRSNGEESSHAAKRLKS